MAAAAIFELHDPHLEYFGRVVEHFKQGRCGGTGFVQPGIQYLLHCPAGLAQVGQSHHATAALQRMVAAPQGDQRSLIVGRGMQQWQMLVDGGEDFVGFLEEDTEQLSVEIFLAGVHQARSLGRRGRGCNRCGRRSRWRLGRCFQTFHFEVG